MKLVTDKGFVKLRSPTRINLELTSKCNWNCEFCSVPESLKSSTPRSSFQSFERIKPIIDEFHKAEVFEVTLFGGEPFLNSDATKIAKYAKELDFQVGFVSNGSFVSKEMAEGLAKYADCGSLSIHGFKNTHERITGVPDSFDKSIDALKILLDANIQMGVCYTVENKNLKELEPFSRYLLDNFGIYYFGANRFVPQGKGYYKRKELEPSIDDFNEVLSILDALKKDYKNKKIQLNDSLPHCLVKKDFRYLCEPCTAGIDFATVDEYGNLKFCSGSLYSLGNVLETPLEEIWQNSPILNEYRSLNWLPETCSKCDIFEQCLCSCRSTQPYRELYGPDILVKEHFGD